MRLKNLIRHTFERGNTCVDGLRGDGKDMLMSNVVARRKVPYISNIDYQCDQYGAVHIPLSLPLLNCGNTYDNIINDDVRYYDYPLPQNCDIYITDCGVVFPSQYCNELNKKYPYIPTFMALSRHLGNCNVHYNVQNLNRVWDKLREQSDIYIKCNSCYVLSNTFLGKVPIIKRLLKDVVIQKVTLYDKYESCLNRVEPFKRAFVPLFTSRQNKANINQYNLERKARYEEEYGTVKRRLLIYKNKSNYDTRYYKALFKGGKHE